MVFYICQNMQSANFYLFFYTYICSKFKGFNILLWCRETKKWTNSNYPNSFRHYLYINPSRNVNRINQILGMKKWFNVRGKTLLSINEIVHLNAFMLSGRDELQLIFDILNVIYGRKSVSIKRKKKKSKHEIIIFRKNVHMRPYACSVLWPMPL